MKSLFAFLAAVCLGVTVAAAPVAAHEWHHDGDFDHHWHHGPHVGLFFGFGGPVFERHWGPPVVIYRSPPPVVVYSAPPPVAIAPPPVHATPASPDYTDSEGRTCREFRRTVTIGGRPQPAYGTACRESDGSWHIVP